MTLFVWWRDHDRDFLLFLDFFFFAVFFFVVFFSELFFAFLAGTFFPSFRASERPMAIACFRLLTFFPDLPLFSVPFFFLRIARATFFEAPFEYLRAMNSLRGWVLGARSTDKCRQKSWFREL